MSSDFFVHEKAIVDPEAVIGKGTRVWAFAHILPGAIVGENCNICDFVFIESGAKLGDQVTVKNGVNIWEGVVAENGVFLGPNCTFTNDLYPRSFLKKPKAEWLVTTTLHEGCTVGANATIVCGNKLGAFSMIGAGAVVTHDVPDYGLVVGNPARLVGWVCRCGERLAFESNKGRCGACGLVYSRISEDQIKLDKAK